MERDINSPTSENDPRHQYIDEKTREKIRKHLSDPNDKITEEDIANVNTDMYDRPETESEQEEFDEKFKEEHPPKAGSAWDISTND